MKILFDFFPIIAFFIAFKVAGIYAATAIAMLASFIQVVWLRYKNKKFETMPLITFFTLLVLGSATLFFQNELFIKWKPTLVYWIMALIFLGSQYVGSKKPLIQRFAGESLALPQSIWNRLNLSWVLYFSIMGVLNLYVVRNYDTDTWVNFKLFGTLILTLIFIIAQGVYMYKHRNAIETKNM